MKEFFLFSTIKDIIIRTLEKVSQNFCFVYKFEILSPFTVVGASGSLVLKGISKGNRGIVYSNFKRRISLTIKEGKIFIGKEVYDSFNFGFMENIVNFLSYYEREALCVTQRNKVKVKVVEGKNVLPYLDDVLKNEIAMTLFDYYKKEVGYSLDKPITVYKIIANKDKIYLQFISNWSFWYVEINEFVKRDYSLIPLIKLNKEIKDILNR